ncbi:MAG: DUF4258 domain-containing protein [Candidatus Muiribacteriota bacterium]
MSYIDFHIKFSGHSLRRMFERNIPIENVKNCIFYGMLIEDYPDDKPYASNLKLMLFDNKPIHVVSATDYENKIIYVITAYYPDTDKWCNNFSQRR